MFEQAPKAFGLILTKPSFGRKEGKEAKTNFDFETGTTQLLFVPDILGELALRGTSAIVLDEGLLRRTNEESAFVETKRKLVDEFELRAVVSLPRRVLSTARTGVKLIRPFFTKGRMTERIWFYDLSQVLVGKKTPLILRASMSTGGAVWLDDTLSDLLIPGGRRMGLMPVSRSRATRDGSRPAARRARNAADARRRRRCGIAYRGRSQANTTRRLSARGKRLGGLRDGGFPRFQRL